MAWRRNERSRTARFSSRCRERAMCVRASAGRVVLAATLCMVSHVTPAPEVASAPCSPRCPRWLRNAQSGLRSQRGHRTLLSRMRPVLGLGHSGVGSGTASQNLRGRGSGEAAVQKLDSRGDPGDSSGCQIPAPRRFLLRPHRIWEAGDFPVIPGERHSIEHVHVH